MSEIDDPLAPVANTWTGRSKGDDANLHDAITDAWNQAKKDGAPALRVIDIYVTGNNPITEYRVIVGGI
jgi:hypothetical protein